MREAITQELVLARVQGGRTELKFAHDRIQQAAYATLTDGDALRLILQPGFSTASRVTEAAGRGVGMDVVANEVRQLGGSLDVRSERGIGTRFTIRLPL